MKSIAQIRELVGDIPFMMDEQAEIMTSLITNEGLSSGLELGFYHGASTCFIANAMSDVEGAKVVAIDRERGRNMNPNIEQLLERCELRKIVDIHYEPNSYIWRLMRFLESDPQPRFDFCYIDGAHNWFTDGFAFFLIDRLLKPGGWIVLDDLNWRYVDSPTFQGSERLANMPKDEAECYQIRKIFELLVQRQAGYGEFREEGNWGIAKKIKDSSFGPAEVITKTIIKERRVGLGEALVKLGRRIGFR